MTKLNFPDLKKTLEKHQLSTEEQKETNQLYAMLAIQGRNFPIFFRIYEQQQLLQILAFLPFEYKPETVLDVGRLLHLFNKELDQPGFGLDESGKVIFFRSMVPASQGMIDDKILGAYLQATKNACELFAPAIYAVASGTSTFDELHTRAQQEMEKQKNKK